MAFRRAPYSLYALRGFSQRDILFVQLARSAQRRSRSSAGFHGAAVTTALPRVFVEEEASARHATYNAALGPNV